jgi:hypothetical protein
MLELAWQCGILFFLYWILFPIEKQQNTTLSG